jgi:pyruvate formate-lyase/glycerol dehydratase family glycyl radical enzyme
MSTLLLTDNDIDRIMSLKTTERVKRLKDSLFKTVPEISPHRAKLVTESYKENEGKHIFIKKSLAFANILENIPIYLRDDELIAGNSCAFPRGAEVFPEYTVNFILEELDGNPVEFDKRPAEIFKISEETKKILKEVLPYWKGKTHEDYVLSILPEEAIEAQLKQHAYDSMWIAKDGMGHIIPDYPYIIDNGIDKVLDYISLLEDTLDLSNPENIKKKIYYKSVRVTLDAVKKYAKRYSDMALELAKRTTVQSRKIELEEISRIFLKIPAKKAESFHEAVQALIFLHLIVQIESNGHSVNIGRFDQFLYPYFKKDIESGVLTYEKALELIQCFWIKHNELNKIRGWEDTSSFVGYQLWEALTIGGADQLGNSQINEISYLCLKAANELKTPMPSLCARYFKNCPRRFLLECAKVIRNGGGIPAMYNDEIAISMLLNRGVKEKDAFSWAIEGCVELQVPGKWGGRNGAGFYNLPKVLEITLYGGTDPVSGVSLFKNQDKTELKKLGNLGDYETLWKEYKKNIDYYLKLFTVSENCVDYSFENVVPEIFLTSMVHDCLERGKTVHEGGAIYDFTGGQEVGFATSADSLAAMKKLVFEDKVISENELLEALDSNFENPNGEITRQILLNKAPKFGNDINYVDDISRELYWYFCNEYAKYDNTRVNRGPIGCKFHPSTATASANVPFGMVVGALPSGRKRFEPVNDGCSPFHGVDNLGPTATLRSVAKMPTLLLSGGQLLNLKVLPKTIEGEEGLNRFADLIKGFFELKGYHVQINVLDNKILIEAQKHPEKYPNLMVRVAGYSALFVPLKKEVQDDIIARTCHKVM